MHAHTQMCTHTERGGGQEEMTGDQREGGRGGGVAVEVLNIGPKAKMAPYTKSSTS